MANLKTQRLIARTLVLSTIFWLFGQTGAMGASTAAIGPSSISVNRAMSASFDPTKLSGVAEQHATDEGFTSFAHPLRAISIRSFTGESRVKPPTQPSLGQLDKSPQRPASTCTVVSRNNAGSGTLRDCLQNAASDDVILFDATVFPSAAPQSIMLMSQLPEITADRLVIDASNAGVILNGSAMSQGSGLVVLGQGNLLSGNGDTGAWVHGAGTTGNRFLGNFVGTDVTGRIARPNYWGIVVSHSATDSVIGGSTASTRNLVSGNATAGIQLQNTISGNRVQGNDIGVDSTGALALGNRWGVYLMLGAHDNVIGGVATADRNVISGNRAPGNLGAGVVIQGQGTDRNRILGNMIGSNSLGTIALGNDSGVILDAGARANIVGGNTPQTGNLISGNLDDGVRLQQPATNDNVISGNYIGVDATGLLPLANTNGIVIGFGAQNNVIGGTDVAARNLISGNREGGIWIQDINTTGNLIRGNFIGVDTNGTGALPNRDGIFVLGSAQNNIIGGLTAAQRNLISGNLNAGIHIQNAGTTNNQVLGNYIGANIAGTAAIPNTIGVVLLADATNNSIGGAAAGSRNLISGNRDVGVLLQDRATNNRILGNYVGTNASGSGPLGNDWGVVIARQASNNAVGGANAGERNLISGNDRGIQIQEAGTTGNSVLGNYIGPDATGSLPLGNDLGVIISHGASNNVIGGTDAGDGNVISDNTSVGVQIQNPTTTNNRVEGNYIGTTQAGTAPLGNGIGVVLEDGTRDNTIGPANVIAYNTGPGVVVAGTNTLGNTITQNSIHLNDGPAIVFPNAPTYSLLLCYTPALNRLSGSTCASCIVEVFANPSTVVEGARYLDTATADGQGNVSHVLGTAPPATMPYLSLTLTDGQGTTGEFHSVPICTAGSSSIFLPTILRD